MKILNKVEQLLKDWPEIRDSDKKLLLGVWKTQGLVLSEEQKRIFYRSCSSAESITRARRALKSKYPASKEVNEERYNKFITYRDAKAVSWIGE
jgi:hypothetical protein